MAEFKREHKYLVLRWDDIRKHLSDVEGEALDGLLDTIAIGRMGERKTENNYVVVNEDEPYAKKVWQLIQEHWQAKQ